MSRTKAAKTIRAVGYLRKSTKDERTEKSIADQKARIAKLRPPDDGARYEIVRWYDRDKGIAGWKRGAKRPDYFRMVSELKDLGIKSLLVDDADRMSRADEMECLADVQLLREKHGIRYIHCVNQGCVDLISDPMGPMKIVMWAMGSRAFSTRLSRRIAEARCDAAKKGLRSGGSAPYGMENDGHGGLKWGDPKQIKIVRWIFDKFVNDEWSLNAITADLNARRVPPRKGKVWYVAAVVDLLKRVEYKGCFRYNSRKSGQFHIVNGKHEVVPISSYDEDKPKPWLHSAEGVFLKEGAYKPIIDPKLFDKAQKRFASFGLKGGRARGEGYPLAGILVCGRCQKPLYGCHPKGRKRVYRCSSNAKCGAGTCGTYEVSEALILPYVLRALGEEIKDIHRYLTDPPKELAHPREGQQDQRKELQQERVRLAAQIARAEENLLLVEDARTRKSLDARVTAMRDELEKLDGRLASEPERIHGYTREEGDALMAWWNAFEKTALSVPVKGKQHPITAFYQDNFSDEQAILLNARKVNEALKDLGAEVRLWWTTKTITTKAGKSQNRYTLAKGRLRLGQKTVILRLARSAAPSSGTPGGCRCGSRRGRGSTPRRA
jgi:DNA invertase Pin-like site-specific DNA recombinase/DNA-binding transcriptional MerR regulator